ncbi:MAG: diguanylate cyclase [Gloeocapsa sp. DLM2.Bin57]|nr:MAG: diguanylate cyclase [Gloeocapsa sp. DLM2.Bin57]
MTNQKSNILIVDDTPDNLRLLTDLLSSRGYKIRIAPDGEFALDSVKANPPDLILLDIRMPNLDGYEVCRRLKANPQTEKIPVIFLSALGEEIDKTKAFAVGGSDYITKPFQLEEVLARINHQLKILDLQTSLELQNQQLKIAEAKYRNIFENAIEGLFQSSLDGRYLTVNPAMARILGYQSPAELLENVKDISSQIYVERNRYQEIRDILQEKEQIISCESTVYRQDGQIVWISENIRLVKNELNEPIYYEGNLQDITERKCLEIELLAAKEFAQTTLKSIGDGVIVTDTSGFIIDCNPIAEQLTGWLLSEIKGKRISEVLILVNEYGQEISENPLDKALKENRIVDLASGTILIGKEGKEYPIQDSAAPIKNNQGEIIGGVVVFYDATESYNLTSQLYWEANHDFLTGLYNRRAFKYYLSEAINTAFDNYLFHILCYFDLDKFKFVNDSCGHEIGDHLLNQITRLLSDKIRPNDVLARLGGDEFGLLLYQTSLIKGIEIANSLREAILNFRFIWQGQIFNLGVSIGLVIIDDSENDLGEIMRRADKACYNAKKRGGNSISIYQNQEQ